MRVHGPHSTSPARERSLRWLAIGAASLVAIAAVALLEQPRNYLLAVTSGGPAPMLEIGVKFADLHPIHEQRDEALQTGELHVTDEDYAPASLEVDGNRSRGELRLAAGPVDALAGEQWPLRVRATKGDQIFGLRELTLRPLSDGALLDALRLDHLERMGVLAARLVFVETALNGKPLGLMALTEVPSTELLERQQRRDGVVVRLDTGPIPAVVALEPARIARSRKLTRDLARAKTLLAGFVEHKLDADVVFDPGEMGRALAVAEHWGVISTLGWDDLRLYLNPLTARLEPIGIPRSRAPDSTAVAAANANSLVNRMLAAPKVRAAFERAREEIGADFSDGEAWLAAARDERALRRLLHRQAPDLAGLDVASLREATRLDLDRLELARTAPGGEPVAESPLPERSVADNLARHPFLSWDAEDRRLRVRAGSWRVSGSMILPEGIGLFVPAATVLRFEPREGLIARGPLLFEGTADEPVVLEGPPGTRRSQLWSGVYVIDSKAPSRWSHVVVRNTGGFKRAGWKLSGGVVFRKTDADLEDCKLLTSLADDALNFVRSTFRLRGIEIRDAASDAVDLDYSQGRVDLGVLARTGGDGLDLGGSRAEVSGTRFMEIRDKAISVGERSHLVARDLHVERVGIAIASKNGSTAEIYDSVLDAIDIVGLVAYTNRSEFGPGSIRAEGNRFSRATRLHLAETGSRIVVDGNEVAAADVSVGSVGAVAAAD